MRFLSLIILCLVSVLSQAQTKIQGNLTDETGAPIVGANILLVESRQGAATDLSGNYTIEGVAAGTYTLAISYVGYQSWQQQLEIPAGKTLVNRDVQLSERIFNLQGLTVTATRASEKTPMTLSLIHI